MAMLNKDEILSIGMCLKLSDLLNLSLINKKYFSILEKIWICKLNKDFEDFYILNLHSSHKEIYTLLYSLNTLKNKIELKESIYELYNLETFGFHKGMISIPKEIWSLRNLKNLDLSYNSFTEIPKELSNLRNLVVLSLDSNEITFIPAEIENLSKLKSLSLSNNKISVLPEEFSKLSNLEVLYIHGNKFSTAPEQLIRSPKLNSLYISVLVSIPFSLIRSNIYIKRL